MKLSRFDYTFRVNRLASIDTFRFIWIGCLGVSIMFLDMKEAKSQQVAVWPNCEASFPFQEKPPLRLQTSSRKRFLCSVKAANPSTMFFSPHSCRGWWSTYKQSPWLWGRLEPAGSCVLWERWCSGLFPGSILESPVWDHSLTPKSEPSQSEMCKLQTLSR